MDFVQAVTAASGEEMDKLKEKAIELGKNSLFGPVQLSQAFVDLAKAGASVEDIIDGVGEASVNLATAADVEIPFAGENLINILNTFKLGAEDAAYVSDLLAGAANASSVELSDMVSTMRYAGPVAAAMGVPIEDLNTALSVLGRVGIKGSIAGTSLRFMMTRLVPDTDKAKDAIKGLGLNIGEDGLVKEFTNADGSLRSLAEIMQVLQDATKGLSDQAKIAVINDIFGVRAMPSVLELMSAGQAGFQELNDEINRTTAADVAAARIDNLAGSVRRLKATLSAIFVEAGGPFQETVKGWVDALRDLLLIFDGLPDPVKKFMISALLAVGVLALFAGGFLLTIGNIVRMVRVMGELTNAFFLIGGGMSKAMKANSLLNLSLLASPWFWLVVAIAAAVVAIIYFWRNSEKFREFVKGLWETIKGWGQAIADFFQGLWGDIKGFFGKIEGAWNSVKGFFSGIGDTLGGAASAVGGFFSSLGRSIADIGKGTFDGVTGFFETLADVDIGSAFVEGTEAVVNFATQLPGLLGSAASSAVNAFVDFIAELPGRLGYILGYAIGRVIRFYIDFYTWIYRLGETVVRTVIDWGGRLIRAFASWIQETAVRVATWVADMVVQAIQMGVQFVANVVSFLMQLPGIVAGFLLDVLIAIVTAIPGIVSAAAEMGLGILTAIWDFVSQIPGRVAQFLLDVARRLLNAIPEVFGHARSIGSSILNGIVSFITGIPGAIWGTLTAGINTIRGMISTAWQAARDFGSGLWNGFKDGLGINSPSFIEKALMAIDEQALTTRDNLARSIRSMQGLGSGIPQMNLSRAQMIPAIAPASTSTGLTVQGPLVGTIETTASEEDALVWSRRLADLTYNQLEAQGNRAARVNGAMGGNV